MSIIIGALKIIVVLGTLIIIHELGHFLVAKACNVKVHKFAIGFGPKIFKKQGKETEYTLRLIPFGGFVQLEGEEERSEDERAFNQKKVYQRILIVAAGATVNIIFSLTLFFFIVISMTKGLLGIAFDENKMITEIVEDTPAYHSELQSGDIILAINGHTIVDYEDISKTISKYANKKIDLKVKRKDKEISLQIKTMAAMGGLEYVSFENMIQQISFENIVYAFRETGNYFIANIEGIVKMFSGNMENVEVSGPVGIAGHISSTKGIGEFLYLMSAISLSLGIFNLLPIPALDGGKILFLIIEKIRKKPFEQNTEAIATLIGFSLIILLAIIVTVSDVSVFFK